MHDLGEPALGEPPSCRLLEHSDEPGQLVGEQVEPIGRQEAVPRSWQLCPPFLGRVVARVHGLLDRVEDRA